jgi:hypothetical protein
MSKRMKYDDTSVLDLSLMCDVGRKIMMKGRDRFSLWVATPLGACTLYFQKRPFGTWGDDYSISNSRLL